MKRKLTSLYVLPRDKCTQEAKQNQNTIGAGVSSAADTNRGQSLAIDVTEWGTFRTNQSLEILSNGISVYLTVVFSIFSAKKVVHTYKKHTLIPICPRRWR